MSSGFASSGMKAGALGFGSGFVIDDMVVVVDVVVLNVF